MGKRKFVGTGHLGDRPPRIRTPKLKCARCGGKEKVVATCASSPNIPSCTYCRQYFIAILREDRLREHMDKFSDWLYTHHKSVIDQFFRENRG